MQIISNGERMLAIMDHFTVEWYTGSHTANVFYRGSNDDCFTFAWEKNRPNMLDFTTALLNWLAED